MHRAPRSLRCDASSWRIKYGEHVLISSGSGNRFSGGRHLPRCDVNFFSLKSHRFDHCVSNFPARPTNGRPCASSSRPGPSPTKTRSPSRLPSPNTILFRVLCSLHRVQSPKSPGFSAASRSRLSTPSKSETTGAGGKIDLGTRGDREWRQDGFARCLCQSVLIGSSTYDSATES